ncbi:hypothetical protein [Hoyosella altamirensis]|uniref:RusA-like resolvase n=1 Tax=Hoyosella altamirensis TaxID=616997 RepID=A0A839RTD8_9ACTN|nr:hypothetical protein [Hoyosella altamirensis]MBB3040172.1 hypothetical protein [Hoyosella altamirensis]
MNQTFTLPGLTKPPLTSNEARRSHWSKQARAKRQVAWSTRAAITQSSVQPVDSAAAIRVIWWAPDQRTRDPDGLAHLGKAVIDELVASGILPGDSHRYVGEVAYRVRVDRAAPRIEVVIASVSEHVDADGSWTPEASDSASEATSSAGIITPGRGQQHG